MTIHLSLWTLVCAVLLPSAVMAQVRVYDRQRDAIAQQALTDAKSIQSGTIFEKQARNLRALSEKDIAVMLDSAKVRMHGYINSFRTWADVQFVVDRAKDTSKPGPKPDATAAKAELDQQINTLNDEIAKLKAVPAEDDSLAELMNVIGDVQPVIAFGEKFIEDKSKEQKPTVPELPGSKDKPNKGAVLDGKAPGKDNKFELNLFGPTGNN